MVKELIFPLPTDDPNPIEVFLFFHKKLVTPPLLPELNIRLPVVSPLHNIMLAGTVKMTSGLTVIVTILVKPLQVSVLLTKWAVTPMVSIMGELPELVVIKEAIFPVPLAAGSPMEVL